MTDLNLAHLRSIAGAATPGPWHESSYDNAIDNADWDCIADDVYYSQDRRYIAAFDPPTRKKPEMTVSLIAPAELAKLVARIETLEAAIQRVRDLHPPRPNSMSALYPTPLCACGKNYPCPTTQALEGDPK